MTDVEVALLVLEDLFRRGRCTRLTELWDRDDSIRIRMPELARGDGKGVLEQWLSDFVIVGPAGLAVISAGERDRLVELVDQPIDKFVEFHRAEKDRTWSVPELAQACGLTESAMAAAIFYRSRYLGGMIVGGFSAETGLHQQVTFTYDIRNRSLFASRVDRAAAPAGPSPTSDGLQRIKVATRLKAVLQKLVAAPSTEEWRSFAAAEWPNVARQLRAFTSQLEGLDSQIVDAADALRTYVLRPLERGDRVNAADIKHVIRRVCIVCSTLAGEAFVMPESQVTEAAKHIDGEDEYERIDVLILTATKDEYDEARKVNDGAVSDWKVEKEGPAGLEVAFRTYSTRTGGRFKVALTYSARMREPDAVAAALPMVIEYEPRYLAMCGACAGWRGKTNLGDVVVGESVWRADAGARTVEVVDGKSIEKFKPDRFGFTLRTKWKQRALSFSMAGAPWLADRPTTLEQQSLWLVERLVAGESNPVEHADRKSRCPDWALVIKRLRKLEHLELTGLTLTAKGKAFFEEELLLNPDGFPEPPEFKVRVGAMATGRNVERDPGIFERLSDTERTVLAVEMEAAALGVIESVSDEIVRWLLVMKGVMDHGDTDKDDRFKPFACRAAAECLIAFLREVVTDETEGAKRRKKSPPTLASGAVPLARMFEEWSLATNPPVTDKLLRAGRADAVARVQAWLAGDPSALGLGAETRDEAIAFIHAAIASLGDAERTQIGARTLVVSTAERWRSLVEAGAPLVLIAAFNDRSITASATKMGHHVAIPVGPNEVRGVSQFVQLPRLGRKDAEKALVESGVKEEEAREIASLARHGLGALRRKLAVNAATLTPDWSGIENGRRLLPALLAGAWNDGSDADQRVLQELCGTPYAAFREYLLQQSTVPDPPIRLTGQIWTIVSVEDAWSLLSRNLTAVDLQKFEQVAVGVLSEADPKYELPEEERWRATIHGKVLQHSEHLREGLAESILLLAARGEDLAFDISGAGGEWATRIVGKILGKCTTWVAWASLSPLLPLLAEAAPDRFLRSVDIDLSGERPVLAELFTDRTDTGLGGSSPHTGLLWALELLAWSPEYLSGVCVALARYAALDPGGKLGNRPIGSLGHIFVVWHPSTSASLEQRLRALRLIIERQPEIGWRVISGLVPTGQGVTTDTKKPKWRDWAPDERANVTYNELAKGTHELVRILLPLAQESGERWTQLIDLVERLAPADATDVLEALEAAIAAGLADPAVAKIRAALRHQVTRHRQFADAAWAMSPEFVDAMDAVRERLEPADLTDRHAWLFDEHVELPLSLDASLRERERVIREKRSDAVKQVFEAHGEEGLLAFAVAVKERGEVGAAVARTRLIVNEPAFLQRTVGNDDPTKRAIGFGYLRGRARDEPDWLRELRNQTQWADWSSRQRADYYLAAENTSATWDQVDAESEHVQRLYWSEVPAYGPSTETELERVVVTLRTYGRLGSAVSLLARWEYLNEGKSNPELIVETLEASLASESTEVVKWGQLSHEVSKLFAVLDAVEGRFAEDRLARLEWNFLPLLEHSRGARVLDKTLAKSPEFFVETLKAIYRADDEGEEAEEVSENRRELASRGYDLLQNWKRLPGLADDGSIDAAHLKTWVAEVRRRAVAAKRGPIADIHVGYALANSPTGTDGVWPHEAVRAVLEVTASEHLEQAIVIGIHNNRGVTTKSFGEGGVQERSIAEQYAGYATRLQDDWPRTGRVVKRIADEYQSEARGEDVRAELEEHLLG